MRASDLRPEPNALAGRTILIAGPNGALGEATARACAAAGARLVLLGRRVPKLNRLCDAIESAGGLAPQVYPLDLEGAGPDDYAQLADTLATECGALHGLMHAAAEFKGLTSLENADPIDLLRALHVNLAAPMLLTRACLPLMRRSEDAAVLFVLDDFKRVGKSFWGGYGVAKHGLAGLIAVLHDETETSPLRVHGVRPGPMRSPLRARAYFAENPGDVVDAATYAPACVQLLSAAGVAFRGQVLELEP